MICQRSLIKFWLCSSCLLLLLGQATYSQVDPQTMSYYEILSELEQNLKTRTIALENSRTLVTALEQSLEEREVTILNLRNSHNVIGSQLENSLVTSMLLSDSLKEMENSLNSSIDSAQKLTRRRNFWRAVAIGSIGLSVGVLLF